MTEILDATPGTRTVPALPRPSLVDRGNGLLYDAALDITWLQDANFARTSKHPPATPRGGLCWSDAIAWMDRLVYHGHGGWRLPRTAPVCGSACGWRYAAHTDGKSDTGYNITAPASELSYMYYVNLGLQANFGVDGSARRPPVSGIFRNGPVLHPPAPLEGDVTFNGVTVRNLQNSAYWSRTAPDFGDTFAFVLVFSVGYQGTMTKDNPNWLCWPVHDGDVAALPTRR